MDMRKEGSGWVSEKKAQEMKEGKKEGLHFISIHITLLAYLAQRFTLRVIIQSCIEKHMSLNLLNTFSYLYSLFYSSLLSSS